MSTLDSKPSRNEEEYFARENARRVEEMRSKLDAARSEAERRSHLGRCPRCGGHLHPRTHHHMRIDVCEECAGTWLDKGELAMLEHVDHSNIRRFVRDMLGLKDEA